MQRFLLAVCLAFALLSAMLLTGASSPARADDYRWQAFSDGTTDQVLLVNARGEQVGVYRFDDGSFAWLLRDGRFSPDGEPPIEPPLAPGGIGRGVEAGEIVPGRIMLSGRVVSRRQAVEAIAATVPDTQGKRWLTVVGPGREKVEADWRDAPQLQPYRDRVVFKSYPAEHWAMRPGFVKTGNPTVYVQAASGTVLSRTDSYDGVEALARELRKADPAYDPARDPDLSRPPAPVPVPQPQPLPPLVQPQPAPPQQPVPAPSPAAEPAAQPQASLTDLARQVPAGVWTLLVSLLAGAGFVAAKALKG